MKKYRIKAHIDKLNSSLHLLTDTILNNIPNKFDDDVYTFDLIVDNVKDITEEVGVDKNGFRAFEDVEITEIENEKDNRKTK